MRVNSRNWGKNKKHYRTESTLEVRSREKTEAVMLVPGSRDLTNLIKNTHILNKKTDRYETI